MNKKINRVMSTAICVCMSGIDISSVATARRYQEYKSIDYYDCNDSNENEKSDSKTNWWWILAPLVPATIFFGGRYLIKNHRANNNNSGNTSNLQNDFNVYDNLDLKLEENDVKTLQTVNKLICDYNYWQAVVQKLKLNSSYCSQNFYNNITKLCYNLCNPEELHKIFESLKLDDKKLIVFFLKDKNCTQKIKQFISQLELDLKSRKEKFNSSNTRNCYNDQMYNKRETVNILESVSSEDFIRLYNQTKFEDNPKNGRLLILPEVVKNQPSDNGLPDIDTALKFFNLSNFNYVYSNYNLKNITKKLKNIFDKYFSDSKLYYTDSHYPDKVFVKKTSDFIFKEGDLYNKESRFGKLITSKEDTYPEDFKFYIRFLYWFEKEAEINKLQDSDTIKKALGLKSDFEFIKDEPKFENIQNNKQKRFIEFWNDVGKIFCQYDANRCYTQLTLNVNDLKRRINCYLSYSKKIDPDDITQSSVFFDILRTEIKENLKNKCVELHKDLTEGFVSEFLNSYDKIFNKLLNIRTSLDEIYHDFSGDITINDIARLMRDTVTPKFIRDILLGRKDLFDFEFKKQVVSNFIKTYTFKENDLEILNNIYDGKLIDEVKQIYDDIKQENSGYSDEEKEAVKIFNNLYNGEEVLVNDFIIFYNKIVEEIEYNIPVDNYKKSNNFLADLAKSPDGDGIDSLFSLAYIFELKNQNYIDFVK